MKAKRRAIAEFMGILIVVAIVVIVGIVLALSFTNILGGGTSRASITVAASGLASPDGSLATITLTLQNTGDGAARIAGIYVESVGGSPAASPTLLGVTGVSVAMGAPTVPTTMPTSGLDIMAKFTQTIMLRLSGTGIYPGHQYRITIVFFDIGSRTSGVATTIVTLK